MTRLCSWARAVAPFALCVLIPMAWAQGQSQPDLIVEAVSVPSAAVTGQPLTVSMTLRNQGLASASASRLSLYFSKDKIKSLDDVAVADCDMKELAPGSSTRCNGPVTLLKSLSPGTYYAIAVANDSGVVLESDLSNNQRLAQNAINVSEGVQVTISKTGAGAGVVASMDSLLQCGEVCSQSFERSQTLTLSATPQFGSVFLGWSGACQGQSACVLTPATSTSATARFEKASTTLYLPWMTQAEGYLSRFALLNTSNRAISYSFLVLPRPGVSVTLAPDQINGTVPPKSQKVVNVSSLVTAFSTSHEAAVVLSSDATGTELTAIYNLVQPSSGSVSNIDFVNTLDRSSTASTHVLPWLTTDANYRSQLVLSNLKDSPVRATLGWLTPSGATAKGLQQELQVPARSQLLVPTSDLVSIAGGQATGLTLNVDAPSGLVRGAYSVFRSDTGAANAVELAPSSPDAVGPTELTMPWFTIVSGYDSSFVLVNRGSVPAAYSVELFGEAGNILEKGVLSGSIPARGQIEIPAKTLLLSTSGPTRAGAVFRVDASPSLIEGTYQVRSQTSGALNQTSMVKPAMRNGASTALLLPWFSRAPGYISRFALLNRSDQPAPFTIEVLPETGNRAVDTKSSGGVIPARGLLVVSTDTIVTGFEKMPRAAAILRVQAADSQVEGLYNIVNPETGSVSNTLLTHRQETEIGPVSVPSASQAAAYIESWLDHAVGFVTASDTLGRPLTFSLEVAPTHGTVILDAVTGYFRYWPDTPVMQNDSFQVQVFNGNSSSLVTINLRANPDPLEVQQWHLDATATTAFASNWHWPKIGINASAAWALGYSGQGVRVALIDTGVEVGHPDLAANVDVARSHNFLTGTNDPSPTTFDDAHGTKVAGIVGAIANNGLGGRGVAPAARLRGYNYLKSQTLGNFADSFGGASYSADNDIFNYSSGGSGTSLPSSTNKDRAVLDTVAGLRGGKGAVITMGAGDGFVSQDVDGHDCDEAIKVGVSCLDPAIDSTKGHHDPIITGALNASGQRASYSSAGASLWIAAPGGEYGYDSFYKRGYAPHFYEEAIVTTTMRGCGKPGTPFNALDTPWHTRLAPECEYTAMMNGTSASSAVVTGVVALMLQANPQLTPREVKYVLAKTAQAIHVDDKGLSVQGWFPDGKPFTLEQGWVMNAAGYWFNNWYGFGAIDAQKAVIAARSYRGQLPPLVPTAPYTYRANAPATVPRQDRNGFEVVFPVNESATVVESVMLNFSLLATPGLRCNQIELTSPSGTKSIIVHASNGFKNTQVDDARMTSHAFYGEPLNGNWRLRFLDVCASGISTQLSPSADQKLTFIAH